MPNRMSKDTPHRMPNRMWKECHIKCRPVLAYWDKSQTIVNHSFAALCMYILEHPMCWERSGTVRNGSERFLARGVCAYCCPVLRVLPFQRKVLLPKASQEHWTSMTCRKQRVKKFSYQQAPMPHDRRKASTKAANIWHTVAWLCAVRGRLHLRGHARCQGASFALRDPCHFRHLEHRAWCEWPAARLWNSSICLGLIFF